MIGTSFNVFGSPQADAAAIAGLVSLVVAVVTVFLADRRNKLDQRLAELKGSFDKDLAAQRAQSDSELADQRRQLDNKIADQRRQLDKEIAEQKMLREYKLDFAAEQVANQLLMHPAWQWRSFKTIQHYIGGFEDDELRRVLVRAGAIRSIRSSDGQEVWGLLERNRDVQMPEPVSATMVCPLPDLGSFPGWPPDPHNKI